MLCHFSDCVAKKYLARKWKISEEPGVESPRSRKNRCDMVCCMLYVRLMFDEKEMYR